jgi:hypothetical protein
MNEMNWLKDILDKGGKDAAQIAKTFSPKKKRIRKLDPSIIRLNDNVRIIIPEYFVRCGYPLTKEIVKDTIITKEQKQAIWKMMESFGEYSTNVELIDEMTVKLSGDGDNTFNDILDKMASVIIRQQGWGGKERKIYTKRDEKLMGLDAHIYSKKVVKTGIYHHGYTSGWEEPEYEPAYLDDEISHVIYETNLYNPDDMLKPHYWFERRCLEKINYD